MAAEVAAEVELTVVARHEAPGAVDAGEAVEVTSAGHDLQREVVRGLQHRVARARAGGAGGLVDVDDGVGDEVTAARRATQLSDARYRNGLVSQLELLDARRSELRNRRQELQVRTAQYVATVGLIRALGGGWGDQPAVKMAAVSQ